MIKGKRNMQIIEGLVYKYLVQLEKTPSQAFEMLQRVCRDKTMSCICVFELHKRFKDRSEEVEDGSRSGRPSTSRTEINENRIR